MNPLQAAMEKAHESHRRFLCEIIEPFLMECVGERIAVELFQLPATFDGCTTRYEVRQVRTGLVLRRFEHIIRFEVTP